MEGKVLGIFIQTFQKLVEFLFPDGMVCLQRCASAYCTVKLFTRFTEEISVRKEWKGMFPPNKFATHRKNGSVRIFRTLFIQKFHSYFDGIDHHYMLPQDLNMRYIP